MKGEGRFEFAEQWNVCCIVLDGTEDGAQAVEAAILNDATYWDGEDHLICARFPNRPQELYTESALRRSLDGRSGMKTAVRSEGET